MNLRIFLSPVSKSFNWSLSLVKSTNRNFESICFLYVINKLLLITSLEQYEIREEIVQFLDISRPYLIRFS